MQCVPLEKKKPQSSGWSRISLGQEELRNWPSDSDGLLAADGTRSLPKRRLWLLPAALQRFVTDLHRVTEEAPLWVTPRRKVQLSPELGASCFSLMCSLAMPCNPTSWGALLRCQVAATSSPPGLQPYGTLFSKSMSRAAWIMLVESYEDVLCVQVNLKEQGQLVRQDEFTIWLGRRKCQRHVFLFEDLILFSKPKRIEGGFDVYIYKRSFKVRAALQLPLVWEVSVAGSPKAHASETRSRSTFNRRAAPTTAKPPSNHAGKPEGNTSLINA